ncbi:hypothetical protein LTR78_008928 [Recurvomyces mirabilis]|uniref:Uncharacterized protein n=1 Tax=Recurvomyces mirabilis TaxID=574656 RepID=A0AAE0TSF8_9PEZI|nr:hypothetical protein LTR78_008928 [Recurvomyces mirabilis]KAK5159729.1 hypothetical protein LTS14_001834 [Recurvomyces mirabilis]
MPLKKKLSVTAIFATRLLTWPVVVFRLFKLSPAQNTDPNLPNITVDVLLAVVMDTALNLASVTCLRPFLRPFQESGYIVSSSLSASGKYGITGANRTRTEAYLMLGTAGSTVQNKHGSIVLSRVDKEPSVTTQPQGMPRFNMRADATHNETACELEERGHRDTPAKAIRVSKTVQVQQESD